MATSSLSLRFTIFFSLSLAVSSSSSPLPPFFKHHPFSVSHSQSPPPIPKATHLDLLSLLGPTSRSSSVNPIVSKELNSCFRFLVPFVPSTPPSQNRKCSSTNTLSLKSDAVEKGESDRKVNELVWWPPESVLELARLAVDSGGDPNAVNYALDPSPLVVPDAEGCKKDHCELTRTPYGRRFISEELNSYLEFLFELIVDRGPSVGLNVSLSRYDLFHGHLFLAEETGRLGILFHAKEYPAYDKEVFPYNMGYCQRGTNVAFDDSMNLRNILWLAPLPSKSTKDWLAPGVLVVLDARPGGIIYRDLIPEYVRMARTMYEDDLGTVAVDVNYLNVGDTKPIYQLFIC